ncbi:hypothetical protein [Peribacillus sp. SCS-155]|uniref:hypothetical protein n=1 Tax=Peribacillus sedimenti TaxID=3115297 RepID=UPI003905AF83
MAQEHDFSELLQRLDPGSEVNVHMNHKTLYNAKFRKFNRTKGIAYFHIDQFYQFGNLLVPISINRITSLDLPVSLEATALINEDDEDE